MSRGFGYVTRFLREALLTCAAIGGALCIILSILAFTGGFSLMMFKTGSMSPTIPAGSVALVQQVPATDLRIGDVVTVERVGALPITHRITGMDMGSVALERVITMRGDANAVDDPFPYSVTEVRIVRASVPHLAGMLVWFGNPWVLGTITIGAGVLVTWAFWPRDYRTKRAHGHENRALEDLMEDASPDENGSNGNSSRNTLYGTGILLITSLFFTPPSVFTADAAPPRNVPSSVIEIRSDLEGAGVQKLHPTDPLYWYLDVDAIAAPDDGELDLSVSAQGAESFGLFLEVRSCAEPWQAVACGSGEQILLPAGTLAVGNNWRPLLTSSTPVAVFLRLGLTATPSREAVGGETASVTVRATAAGETVDTGMNGGPPLPPTGSNSMAMLAGPAAVMIGLGIALLARRRQSRLQGGDDNE